MKSLGYGEGYQYSHNGPKGWQAQGFLPEDLGGEVFYEPADWGYEKHIKEFMKWLKAEKS